MHPRFGHCPTLVLASNALQVLSAIRKGFRSRWHTVVTFAWGLILKMKFVVPGILETCSCGP